MILWNLSATLEDAIGDADLHAAVASAHQPKNSEGDKHMTNRHMTSRSRTSRSGATWLVLLLGLAAVALLLQFWPAFESQILWGLDLRNWSSSMKFMGNVAVVLVLIGIRFGPNLLQQWRERRQTAASERTPADEALEMKNNQ